MGVQKMGGARPFLRVQRILIWVIFGVVCLILCQFWTYQKTWSSDPPNSPESGTALEAKIRNSWLGATDGDSIDGNPDLRALREIFTLCSLRIDSDGSEENEANALNGDCLLKLQENFPSLQPSHRVDEGPSQALRNEVDKLGSYLKNSTVFLELKDIRRPGLSQEISNWFMSSIPYPKRIQGLPEELEFPSELSQGRLLCLMGNHRNDGTQNKYGFAWKGYLPPGATLLPGLSFVSDNYWDYNNIWHAMSALVGFVSWRGRNDCAVPERLLLYHWGEHIPSMGSWIDNVLHASFGRKLNVEQLGNRSSEEPLCFERAIVYRRGLGGTAIPNLNALFETIRCRARRYCNVLLPDYTKPRPTHVTLFLRTGPRAFRNSTAVWKTLDAVCEKDGNCDLEVAYASNLSFCEQVAVMTRTDVLVTTHGAQMTNMMFMVAGGSVMELIPKGWFELAGIGQYIYSWLASWANIHYAGVWRDQEGPDCPHSMNETFRCFLFHKDLEVGHNATHLTEWTTDVIKRFRETRSNATIAQSKSLECNCVQEDS